jgi:membrane-bound lytic murein transglycosylase D
MCARYSSIWVAAAVVSTCWVADAGTAFAQGEALPEPPEPAESHRVAPEADAPSPDEPADPERADAHEVADLPEAPEVPASEVPEVPASEVIEAIEDAMARATAEAAGAAADAPGSVDAIAIESVPPALSSDAEPAPVAAREATLGPELDWLAGAALPDFPVRWDDRLVEQLLYFRDNPQGRAQVRSLIARSGRYSDMIRGKLDERSLPADLLYVAMAESGYDPLAKSPAGAVGG